MSINRFIVLFLSKLIDYIYFIRLIKKNRFQGFSLQLVRKFAHSILQCLDALHRNKIIHCGKKRIFYIVTGESDRTGHFYFIFLVHFSTLGKFCFIFNR